MLVLALCLVDFGKASDMVDHAILARKVFSLQAPGFVIHWIIFVTDRTQATKLGLSLSSLLSINRSIVQGSGIGPTLFIMFAHDLEDLDMSNYLLKYADDASLLSPQNSHTPVELEMAHVVHWARENKMSLNLLKTVELVFRSPNVSGDLLPPALPDINRVCDAKLLGVYFRHDF